MPVGGGGLSQYLFFPLNTYFSLHYYCKRFEIERFSRFGVYIRHKQVDRHTFTYHMKSS